MQQLECTCQRTSALRINLTHMTIYRIVSIEPNMDEYFVPVLSRNDLLGSLDPDGGFNIASVCVLVRAKLEKKNTKM